MSIFTVVSKKSHFSRLTIKNVSLTLSRFACKTNRDSESRTKTIPDSCEHHKSNGSLRFGK